jgi:hypothetical protein
VGLPALPVFRFSAKRPLQKQLREVTMSDIQTDHATRIALLEQSRREDKLVQQKMADDLAKIAHAVVQQAEDRSALQRAFSQLEVHSKVLESLADRMNTRDLDDRQRVIEMQSRELAEAERRREAVSGEVWRTIGIVIATVTAAIILYHFGIRG